MQIEIRPFTPDDDLVALTRLIHAAYGKHAAAGLRYWGTHQSVGDTAGRFAAGAGLVMLRGGNYIGTIVVRPPQPQSTVPLYRDPGVHSLSQFCVAPAFTGQGFGKRLHDAAIEIAIANGARVVALDTARPATALIAMYQAWGYSVVGECDWRPHTNYVSVLMAMTVNMAGGVVTSDARDVPGGTS